MTGRRLWDTQFPQAMCMLARAIVDTEREGSEAMPGLWAEMAQFEKDFDGTIDVPAKATHFWDEEAGKFFFDVYCLITTKGTWKRPTGETNGIDDPTG